MHRRRLVVLFVVAEVLLALAIPFLLIQGYHTLLRSRTGTFIEEPSRSDPGWTALVDPTEVVGMVEVDQGRVTGLTLLVHNPQVASAGTAILVPGTLQIDGVAIADRTPVEAISAISVALRLDIRRTEILDTVGWQALLGPATYVVENPDPVPSETAEAGPLVPVGETIIGADLASAFLGRPAVGAVPMSVLPRRQLFWEAVLADPPVTNHPVSDDLAALDRPRSRVIDLPLGEADPAVLDPVAVEALIRDVVAYPAGAVPGDRLRVRLVDRTGGADLEKIAAEIAAQGIEVTQIGNAPLFDDGPTEIIAPASMTAVGGDLPPEVDRLAGAVGLAEVIIDSQPIDEEVVTVVIGDGFALPGSF